MKVRGTARRQICRKINDLAKLPAHSLETPAGGWIACTRKALGMSGTQLGKRLSLSRARISQAENAELEGRITLRSMQDMAEAMGCRFVYAVVPPTGDITDVVADQARKQASQIVKRAATHMALEKQSLSHEHNKAEIERLARSLMDNPPSHFWDE